MSMSDRVFPQLIVMELLEAGVKTELDLKGWLATQDYFVDSPITATSFTLRAANPSRFLATVANDCNRMMMASFESMAGICRDSKFSKNGSWTVIRSYYASFFAVHGLMRLFGASCSQFESTHLNKVLEIASLCSNDGGLRKIESGFYSVEFTSDCKSIKFKKLKDSHKDTWGVFQELISNLETSIPKVTAQSQYKIDAIKFISDIRILLSRNNCTDKGNWMSTIRNSVNYQHSHGTWYPYTQEQIVPQLVDAMQSSWKQDLANPISDANDLKSFMSLSAALVGWAQTMILNSSKKAKSLRPTFKNGSLRMLHLIHKEND